MAYRIAVVGGGLGGLTAALLLSRSGHEVTLLEQAMSFRTEGAGIQLSPNASRVLERLGLGPTLAARATATTRSRFRHFRTGRTITEAVLGERAAMRYGAPYWQIHRADLHRALQEAAEATPGLSVHLGQAVRHDEIIHQGDQLSVTPVPGPFDCVIGADGIHSQVRRWCFGAAPSRFTGQVAWRFLVDSAALPSALKAPESQVWWGPGAHFVHYPVAQGRWVNCVAVQEAREWTEESWSLPGEPGALRSAFEGWHADVQALTHHAEEATLFKWGLFDRRPLPSWHRGPVTLLGDACHPTLPFLAQGAAMAIEDAATLNLALTRFPSLEEALSRYEGWRRPRTTRIQRTSRRYGWVYHLGAPIAWFRDRAAPLARARTMDWLYRYDPEAPDQS
jgi:salicylate hydroxylase